MRCPAASSGLAIAGVLALRPGLLLLDEPTANLDPDGAAAIREVVASVVERLKLTLIMVEHRVAEALPLVDRVVAIEAGGGVMADGRPYDVFARHGDALAEAGVWVPDRRLRCPAAAGPSRRRCCWPSRSPSAIRAASCPRWRAPTCRCEPRRRWRSPVPTAVASPRWRCCWPGLLPPTYGIVVAGEAGSRPWPRADLALAGAAAGSPRGHRLPGPGAPVPDRPGAR